MSLFAQVQLTRDDEVHVMSARNVSLGGLFVDCTPEEAPELLVGRQVEVVLFAPEEASDDDGEGQPAPEPVDDVRGTARIVRAEVNESRSGFGLQFSKLDPPNMRRLAVLIKKLG